MSIVMRPETEDRLHTEAERQGQDVDALLNSLLDALNHDLEEEVAGVQKGLTDIAAGRTRTFKDFIAEHRTRYPIPENGSASA